MGGHFFFFETLIIPLFVCDFLNGNTRVFLETNYRERTLTKLGLILFLMNSMKDLNARLKI